MNGLIYANTVLNEKPKLYAIVIGIGDYPNAKFSSKFTKNDATAIYQKLKTQVGHTYTEGNLQLFNQPEQTTQTAIWKALEDIQSKIKPEDALVVFIAGEADYVDEEYYLFTSQSLNFSAEQLKQTGISATQLKNFITNISARNKLILLDTPWSDSVMKITDLFATHHLHECHSGMIITAGRYTLNEGFRGHSLFTYAVIDALSGIADRNKNGFIESGELAQYVRSAVPAIAQHISDRRQMPYIDQCGDNVKFKKIPRE
ncbi:caspase family protein [Acinetobacter johnsonii]|uniref:caspase family protein n=1 Tax=Acinetobacter TaxID=469 RepID=UPI003F549A35